MTRRVGGAARSPWHYPVVSRSDAAAAFHTALVVGIWGGLAPAALVRDDSGALDVQWRWWPFVMLAVLALLVGSALIHQAGRALARSGAHLFTTRPGPNLVTDGWYARLRNPQELGTVLVSIAPAIALAPIIAWLVPLVAIVYEAVALGPYEERRLEEAFTEDYDEYRASVGRWIPRRPT